VQLVSTALSTKIQTSTASAILLKQPLVVLLQIVLLTALARGHVGVDVVIPLTDGLALALDLDQSLDGLVPVDDVVNRKNVMAAATPLPRLLVVEPSSQLERPYTTACVPSHVPGVTARAAYPAKIAMYLPVAVETAPPAGLEVWTTTRTLPELTQTVG